MYSLSNHPPTLKSVAGISAFAVALAITLGTPTQARAADLCVDQHARPGCTTTISAAVAAASPGDTIRVQPGVYHEDVVISVPLSLVGADRDSTIVDATGLSNGIFIDGFHVVLAGGAALDHVTVSGFTIRNANFEGILANDVAQVSIFNNVVIHNDQSLRSSACPGLPSFETADTADCGQAIHLIGAEHSFISRNLIEANAGGILISDESSTTHDNLITNNQIDNNPYAPGITIASHPVYFASTDPQPASVSANGVYNISVLHNSVLHNGFGGAAPAPGIALLALTTGTRVFANAIASNQIIENAGAGIVVHVAASLSRAGKLDASRNAFTGNMLSGNGPDSTASTTQPTGISLVGLTPIVDTLITENSISNESLAVGFNSASTLDVHLNSFNTRQTGIANFNPAGLIEAQENWWGCSSGPSTPGCSSIVGGAAVLSDPWLTSPYGDDHDHSFDSFFAFFHHDDDGLDHH